MLLPRPVVLLCLVGLSVGGWLVTPLVGAEERDERLLPKESPSKAYVCSIGSGKGGYGNVVTLRSSSGNRSVVLHASDRWVEVSWSPDSRWLLVTDHWDGHGANIRIYEVPENSAAEEWKVREVYATPDPTRYDCKWSLLEWKQKGGSVVLKCDYRDFEGGVVDGKSKRVSKTREIPLGDP